MAKLEKKETNVTYVLELTEKEANYLELVLRKTIHTREDGDAIWRALDDAGITGEKFYRASGEIHVRNNN